MNNAAFDAIEKTWALTIKARALCPYTDASMIGQAGYISPPWYRTRGAVYFVNLAKPLTSVDVHELNQIGSFVNRSFVISMAAVLEEHHVVRPSPDHPIQGGDHVQLTIWLRNRFAHGEWEYNADEANHVETRTLLERLFPRGAAGGSGFVLSIDSILEPLKDGVLQYIRAAT